MIIIKILFLIPYIFVPPNSGNKNLTFNLLKYVTKHAVCDLVLLINKDADCAAIRATITSEFPDIGQIWLFVKPQGIRLLIAQLEALSCGFHPVVGKYKNPSLTFWLTSQAESGYDIIQFDMFYMAQYWQCCTSIPRLLVASDAYSNAVRIARQTTSNQFFVLLALLREILLRNYEKNEYKNFHTVCTVSKTDSNYLKSTCQHSNVKTIGVAVQNKYLNSQEDLATTAQKTANILCTSSGSISRVHESVLMFLQNCYPAILENNPNTRLTVLGRNLSKRLINHIKCMPAVQHLEYVEDYLSFLKQNWVYVYPQNCGSGLKTKVQQAMALGLPVVGSEQAFSGLEVENGRHCFVCKSSDEFCEAINNLLKDSQLRVKIGLAASNYIRDNFSVEVVGREMIAIYCETIDLFKNNQNSK